MDGWMDGAADAGGTPGPPASAAINQFVSHSFVNLSIDQSAHVRELFINNSDTDRPAR